METIGPHTDKEASRFRAAIERNATLLEVLQRAATLNLPDWYLAAGSITQTVWNMVTDQPAETGIDDYDLVYFDDSDLSWEAEDKVIQAGSQVFASLSVRVEIRNQARVHLWYADRFGIPGRKHMSTEGAIASWLSGTALIGIRLLPNSEWRVFAPWGLSDILGMIARPNPVSGSREAYENKVDRWKKIWPGLIVIPWPHEPTTTTMVRTKLP